MGENVLSLLILFLSVVSGVSVLPMPRPTDKKKSAKRSKRVSNISYIVPFINVTDRFLILIELYDITLALRGLRSRTIKSQNPYI